MRKHAQLGFAMVLVALSCYTFFSENDQITMFITASVVPSFLLTVTSFIEEIMERCEEISVSTSKRWNGASRRIKELQKDLLPIDMDIDILENEEKESYQTLIKIIQSFHHQAKAYEKTQDCIVRLNRKLTFIYVFSYALFFLSIILAPQIIRLFENVNVNCISLWSLTILFVNNELKPELCEFVFTKINKYINGANNQNIS